MALVAMVVVVVQLLPKLWEYLDRAMDGGRCADWKVWIPSGLVFLLVMGGLLPTAFRDLRGVTDGVKGIVEAAGALAAKIRGAGK